MNHSDPPSFDTGTVLVTAGAFELLRGAGVAPAELLAEHLQLIPAKAVASDVAARISAIYRRQRVLTRFPVLAQRPQLHVAEVCVVTEPGHRLTLILLPVELR